MSTADQILGARIAAIAARHCGRGTIDALDRAVAELRKVAGDWPDLLAELAGTSLSLAAGSISPLAPRYCAEAELARAAGADEALIGQWIKARRKRAQVTRRVPFTGAGQ